MAFGFSRADIFHKNFKNAVTAYGQNKTDGEVFAIGSFLAKRNNNTEPTLRFDLAHMTIYYFIRYKALKFKQYEILCSAETKRFNLSIRSGIFHTPGYSYSLDSLQFSVENTWPVANKLTIEAQFIRLLAQSMNQGLRLISGVICIKFVLQPEYGVRQSIYSMGLT